MKRKRKRKWKKGKKGTRDMGKREEERKEIREAEFMKVEENMDFLGNPYDMMDINTKKHHALSFYYEILKVILIVCLFLGSALFYFCLFVCL